jgi:PadR family transcriptional regulator PadR
MENLHNQFKKGVLEIIVLNLISKKAAYGYEIITTLDEISDGYYKIREGSLYPILYRLEDKELIESFRNKIDTSRKIPRKYYRITSRGQDKLKDMKIAWQQFSHFTNKVL